MATREAEARIAPSPAPEWLRERVEGLAAIARPSASDGDDDSWL